MHRIWTFKDNEAIETEQVDLKTFKASGKFYEDVELLSKMFNVKVHPALKPVVYPPLAGEEHHEEQKPKELNTLNLYKHRIDKNSFRVMFLCLPASPGIHTLKFQNNGFTHQQFSTLIDYLSQETCPIQHLFFDWNPIYENDYSTQSSSNKHYQKKNQDELCLFAKLLKQNNKLQVLFLRASNLQEDDLLQMCHILKPDPAAPNASNKTLKVLDISYNPKAFTDKSIKALCDMMETNRTLEYLGIAKNGIKNEHVESIIHHIGKIPFPQDQVDAHLNKLKQRDAVIEKNKKLKASKKPEEPVPILDNIEQTTIQNSEGQDVPGWVILKNIQFKHLNLCMNDLNDEIKESLINVIKRTNDEFGFTLSGNSFSKDCIDKLQAVAQEHHQKKMLAHSDPNQQTQIDQQIGMKRITF